MYRRANPSKRPNILTFSLLAAVVLASFAPCVSAQEGGEMSTAIKRLEIAFWPEYDKPEVLVMYRGELDASAMLPARISLPIPIEVGEPHAVAWRNPQGGLMTAQYSLEVADGRAMLHVTVPSLVFRVEYYGALERDGDLRSYTFDWPGGVAISEFAYDLQKPLGATELEVSPIPGGQIVGGDGLTYARAELGTVAAGASSEIEFSYRKPTDALTANALAPASPPPQALPPATPPAPIRPPSGGSSPTQWWPVYVAVAILVGLVAGMALQKRKS